MVLNRHLNYDTKRDELNGLHNINGEVTKECDVVMVRGVVINWKQPIVYPFVASPKYYKEIETWLDEVIFKLLIIGIEIRALVSNQGSNLDKYAKEINKLQQRYEYSMFQNSKLYYIFDVPNLIKCIRNNLPSNDFICSYDGKRTRRDT